MPDVREVYEMVTKQKQPEPGALERQQKRQVRSARNKKVAAFAVAAAIGVLAIVLILRTHPGLHTTTPATGSTSLNPVGTAEEVATGFLEAFGAFNAEQATTFLAADADLTGFIGSGYSEGPEGLPRFISFLRAEGYEQTITSCDGSTVGPDVSVVCGFDFTPSNPMRSGEAPSPAAASRSPFVTERSSERRSTSRSTSSRRRCGSPSRTGSQRRIRRTPPSCTRTGRSPTTA